MTQTFNGPVTDVIHENGVIEPVAPKLKRRRAPGADMLAYSLVPCGSIAGVLSRLSPMQLRIVDAILADYRQGQPWARMTAAELAVESNTTEKGFYRALAPLRRAGIVIRSSSTMWQVNPHVGWRGSRESWEAALKATSTPELEALRG